MKYFLGSLPVDRVYLGNDLVYPAEQGIIDQEHLYEQWVAADASSFGEGQLVSAWTGRVNGLVAAQDADIRKPRYYGGVGGVPGLLFAGSLLNTPRFNSPTQMTVYAKVYLSTAPAGTHVVACQDHGGNARSWHMGYSPTAKARMVSFNNGVAGSTTSVPGAFPLNQWSILHGWRDVDPVTRTGTMTAALNNESMEGVATNVLTDLLYMSIGGRGGVAELMNGYIGELRVYLAVHDEATRAAVRNQMES